MGSKKMADGMSQADRGLVKAVDLLLSREDIKPRIDDVVSHLETTGHMPVGDDAIREWKREKAREALQLARRAHAKAGEVASEPVHLFEYDAEGNKVDYWRTKGTVNAEEAVQDTLTWQKAVKVATKRLRQRIDFYTARLGQEYQNLLPLDIYDVA